MISVQALIEKFNLTYAQKWGYIWGQSGAVWTETAQAAATRAQTVKWGKKWIGRRVADCSGLFVWAFKQLGGSIYHGSNTIWKSYTTDKGKLAHGARDDGQELKPGTAVFMTKGEDRHHIGLYIGNGYVIEAKGTYYGVVRSKITSWNEWAELKGVDYGGKVSDTEESTATVIAQSGSTVRLRPEPNTSKAALANVPIGAVVEVTGAEINGWTPIRYQGVAGYMMSKFLRRGGGGE